MTKITLYKYIGYNGTVLTPVLLPGIDHLEMVQLTADNGYYLTNGEKNVSRVTVLPNAVNEWKEVEGNLD